MMGGCGSICDCLQCRGKEKGGGSTVSLPASQEPPVDNPFRPTRPRSSKEIYYIVGPHPNGVKY